MTIGIPRQIVGLLRTQTLRFDHARWREVVLFQRLGIQPRVNSGFSVRQLIKKGFFILKNPFFITPAHISYNQYMRSLNSGTPEFPESGFRLHRSGL